MLFLKKLQAIDFNFFESSSGNVWRWQNRQQNFWTFFFNLCHGSGAVCHMTMKWQMCKNACKLKILKYLPCNAFKKTNSRGCALFLDLASIYKIANGSINQLGYYRYNTNLMCIIENNFWVAWNNCLKRENYWEYDSKILIHKLTRRRRLNSWIKIWESYSQ